MVGIQSCEHAIHLVLKELLEKKSRRDRISFTTYQLAKAIQMPHSIVGKLVHQDPGKRVHNPRIDTLARIVDFFKKDGFNISIDDFFGGIKAMSAVKVDEQAIGVFSFVKSIPVYSMECEENDSIGVVDIKLTIDANNTIALLSDEDIKPMFKKGSIFVVDTSLKPENDTLVALKVNGESKIFIRKFYIEGRKAILKSYDHNVAPIELIAALNYQIIGVIIQVNAKT